MIWYQTTFFGCFVYCQNIPDRLDLRSTVISLLEVFTVGWSGHYHRCYL